MNVGSDHAFAVMLDPRRIARAVSVPRTRACFITCGNRPSFREVKGPVSPPQSHLFTKSIDSSYPNSPSSTFSNAHSLLPRIHPSRVLLRHGRIEPTSAGGAVRGRWGCRICWVPSQLRPRTYPYVDRLTNIRRSSCTQTNSPSVASTSWRRRTLSSPRTAQKLA
jgi:hypothetical protein